MDSEKLKHPVSIAIFGLIGLVSVAFSALIGFAALCSVGWEHGLLLFPIVFFITLLVVFLCLVMFGGVAVLFVYPLVMLAIYCFNRLRPCHEKH